MIKLRFLHPPVIKFHFICIDLCKKSLSHAFFLQCEKSSKKNISELLYLRFSDTNRRLSESNDELRGALGVCDPVIKYF